ncbi:hypothetical protein D3C71_1989720 [compost metagenome]
MEDGPDKARFRGTFHFRGRTLQRFDLGLHVRGALGACGVAHLLSQALKQLHEIEDVGGGLGFTQRAEMLHRGRREGEQRGFGQPRAG